MAKILVVDDEPDFRLALRYILTREGHEVQEAEDGEAAIAYVMQRPVDLVLLDIRLPGVDGIEALKKIREFRESLPVVMITGYGSVETAVELLKLGASQYLQKPFDNEQLLKVVAETLVGVRPPPDSHALHRSMLAQIGLVSSEAAAAKLPAAAAGIAPLSEVAATPSPAPTVAPTAAPMRAVAAPAIPPVMKPEPTEATVRVPPPAPRPWRSASTAAKPLKAPAPRKPPPPPPKSRAPLFVVLAAVAAGAAYAVWSRLPKVDNRDIPLAQQTPTGLAWTPEGLWVADWATETVSLLNWDFRVIRRVKLEGLHPGGLAAAPGYLYISDPFRRVIERRRLDKDLTLEGAKSTPGPSPSGLAYDGASVWSVDSKEGRVYRHDPVTLDARASYPAPAKQPVGIYVQDQDVWTIDGETKLLYRHSISPTLPVQESLELTGLPADAPAWTAFTFHDGHFWLTRDGAPVLLKRHPSAFSPKEPLGLRVSSEKWLNRPVAEVAQW